MGFHIVDFGPLLAEKEEEGGLSSDISTKIMECFQEVGKAPCALSVDVLHSQATWEWPGNEANMTHAISTPIHTACRTVL